MGILSINYMNLSSVHFWCDPELIKMDASLKLWEAITTDGGQNPLVTRFFHNKPYFYFVGFLRCYLSLLDPFYLLVLAVFGGFSLWRRRAKR